YNHRVASDPGFRNSHPNGPQVPANLEIGPLTRPGTPDGFRLLPSLGSTPDPGTSRATEIVESCSSDGWESLPRPTSPAGATESPRGFKRQRRMWRQISGHHRHSLSAKAVHPTRAHVPRLLPNPTRPAKSAVTEWDPSQGCTYPVQRSR